MTPAEMATEGRRLSTLLDAALHACRDRVQATAEAERQYRLEKAKKWVTAPEGTAAAREAWVNGATADLRYERDLAAGMERNARDAIRSYQVQISLLQSVAKAHSTEAELARTGPS
jgi:hypothetical protein